MGKRIVTHEGQASSSKVLAKCQEGPGLRKLKKFNAQVLNAFTNYGWSHDFLPPDKRNWCITKTQLCLNIYSGSNPSVVDSLSPVLTLFFHIINKIFVPKKQKKNHSNYFYSISLSRSTWHVPIIPNQAYLIMFRLNLWRFLWISLKIRPL